MTTPSGGVLDTKASSQASITKRTPGAGIAEQSVIPSNVVRPNDASGSGQVGYISRVVHRSGS